MAKKWKVRGLAKALENVPIEDRFSVGVEIKKMLENFDPSQVSPVREIQAGVRTCPDCGGKLTPDQVLGEDGPPEARGLLVHCPECDEVYFQPELVGDAICRPGMPHAAPCGPVPGHPEACACGCAGDDDSYCLGPVRA